MQAKAIHDLLLQENDPKKRNNEGKEREREQRRLVDVDVMQTLHATTIKNRARRDVNVKKRKRARGNCIRKFGKVDRSSWNGDRSERNR